MSGMPKTPTLTAAQLLDTPAGADVNVAIEIDTSTDGTLAGCLIEPDPDLPFTRYHRTAASVRVRWSDETRIVMGLRDDVEVGAPVWITGVVGDDDTVDATMIALLCAVAEIAGS